MTDADWQRVAERVRHELSVRGLNEHEVYRRSKVDQRTLAKLLDGREIRSDSLRRLADVFGWRPDAWDLIRQGREPIEQIVAPTLPATSNPVVEHELAVVKRRLADLEDRMDRVETRQGEDMKLSPAERERLEELADAESLAQDQDAVHDPAERGQRS